MAQILEVTCRACGEEETQLDGPVLAGYRPRCAQCGDSRLVPWDRTAGGLDEPHLRGEALDEVIDAKAGTCSCGGRFSLDAPLRCSVCRSVDVSTTFYGIAD
jgi:hypothetical protein